jgi:hypothetical protein
MASSSSNSFNSSTASESSQEMTPEFDSEATHEAYAPLHWDPEEWDIRAWLEDDESLSDGEDLKFLLDRELKDEDDDESWDGYDPSSEEEEDDESIEEDLTVESFLRAGRLAKMMMETAVGTPTMEPIVMMALLVMTTLEMMATTGATTMVMSAQVLRSSAIGFFFVMPFL